MPSVYLLHHVHEFNDGHEDVKLIGVYSTRTNARAALDRVKDQPGFRQCPEGFEVSEVEVDQSGWLEGYVTVDPSELESVIKEEKA
jgi:hypothetical protein